MNRISVKSTKMYLNDKVEENQKYVETLTDKRDIEQGEEIIKSLKNCLKNERAEELILEWNKLFDKALEIKKEAERIDLDFAKVFKL